METLKSMTDFTLEQCKLFSTHQIESLKCIERINNYASFLKQPLTLGMFVPFDFEGNPLKEPRDLKRYNDMFLRNEQVQSDWMAECLFYERAKECVLFEVNMTPKQIEAHLCHYPTIVDMQVDFDITLTESAIKQIGL
jgi:hypothetical protein